MSSRRLLFFYTLAFLAIPAPASSNSSICQDFYGASDQRSDRSSRFFSEDSRRHTQEYRNSLVKEYLHHEVTSQKEREHFMQSGIHAIKPNRIVIEFENSRLKFLNDVLNDKDLITSIDNYANLYILHKIKRWIYKNFDFGISIKIYSDGKSLTLIVDARNRFSEEDFEHINAVFAKFQIELGQLLKSKNLFRDSDKVEDWFRMGVGRTVDEAYFSARISRKLSGPNQVKHYSNHFVQSNLGILLQHAEDSRNRMAESPQLRTFFQKEDSTGKLVPKPELFDILRKVSAPEDIQKLIKDTMNWKITKKNAELLSIYAEIIDLLNPKFFVVDQSAVTLANAVYGGIVVDRKGMGSANQVATATAAAKSSTPSEFLIHNRLEEEKVTGEITAYRQRMESEWEAKCRGDDCVIEDSRHIDSHSFLNSDLILGQRVVFVPAGITDSHSRSEMSTHGEAIEKLFAKDLVKNVSGAAYKNATFAIDFQTTQMNTGAINLLVNPLKGPLDIKIQKQIHRSFQAAVREFNSSRIKQNKPSSYHTANIVTL